ncbi:probable serine/threonine-protein kinase PBL10 isoform X1 [Coffea arabica]|uniref:Probable serine/threonine-protein kinase PBL10 isoform X1 n=1 Tax=Coffea arabica TaxID=13443 RepID=A0ABM4WIP2_COFAR
MTEMAEAGKSDLLELTNEQLNHYTAGFSEENFLGQTMFGMLFRGKIINVPEVGQTKEVIVKIWKNQKSLYIDGIDKCSRLKDEVRVLQQPRMRSHPNLVNLIGYSDQEEPLGVVYDLNPRDILQNLLVQDDFGWLQRIKVALGFARLLEFLTDNGAEYLVRKIDATQVMIDQDYNPLLFEFVPLSDGVVSDMSSLWKRRLRGAVLRQSSNAGSETCLDCDVYGYGVILVSLIAKRVADKERPGETSVDLWAREAYMPKKSFLTRKPQGSLVNATFENDPNFDKRDGPKITDLAMRCIQWDKPPNMKEVVQRLEGLHVAKDHSEALAFNS